MPYPRLEGSLHMSIESVARSGAKAAVSVVVATLILGSWGVRAPSRTARYPGSTRKTSANWLSPGTRTTACCISPQPGTR